MTSCNLVALVALALGAAPALARDAKERPRPDGKPAGDTKGVKGFVLLGQSDMPGSGRVVPKEASPKDTSPSETKGVAPKVVHWCAGRQSDAGTAHAGVALKNASLVAAPVPKGAERKPLYFPTAVGAKWVYETPDGGVETAVVSEVEKGDDGLIVSRAGADGTRAVYRKVVVSADGLRQRGEDADQLGWVLKTNVKSGDSWDSPDGKRTVHGPEEVQVPAGKFSALRVVWGENGATYTSWYAPGIGEVKRVRKLDGTETVTRSLKSFQLKDGK